MATLIRPLTTMLRCPPLRNTSSKTQRRCVPQEAARALLFSLQSKQFSTTAPRSMYADKTGLRKLLAPFVKKVDRGLSPYYGPVWQKIQPHYTPFANKLSPHYKNISKKISPRYNALLRTLAPLYKNIMRRLEPRRKFWRNWYIYNRGLFRERGYPDRWLNIGIAVCAILAASWVWSVAFVLVMFTKQAIYGPPERNFRDRNHDELTRDLIDKRYVSDP